MKKTVFFKSESNFQSFSQILMEKMVCFQCRVQSVQVRYSISSFKISSVWRIQLRCEYLNVAETVRFKPIFHGSTVSGCVRVQQWSKLESKFLRFVHCPLAIGHREPSQKLTISLLLTICVHGLWMTKVTHCGSLYSRPSKEREKKVLNILWLDYEMVETNASWYDWPVFSTAFSLSLLIWTACNWAVSTRALLHYY